MPTKIKVDSCIGMPMLGPNETVPGDLFFGLRSHNVYQVVKHVDANSYLLVDLKNSTVEFYASTLDGLRRTLASLNIVPIKSITFKID
jgi:hypothetical protein